MDEIDHKILVQMEKGIALTREPFDEIAPQLGITQQEVIMRLTKLKAEGVIRRFGASIKPNNIGFSANALVAWKVPPNRIKEVGVYLSSLPQISHCYERKAVPERWEYNLYTVMHARERDGVQFMVNQISTAVSLSEYKILYSKRDLKRTVSRLDGSAAQSQSCALKIEVEAEREHI